MNIGIVSKERLTEMECAALRAIEDLDLEPIKVKLCNPDQGEGWTRKKVEEFEVLYKQFLFLNFKYSEQSIVPTHDLDEFWHAHILDTRKYAEDCDRIFGRFLHHFPYFGMRGEEDAVNLRDSFAETKKLFAREFISVHDAHDGKDPSDCKAERCAKCLGPSDCAGCNTNRMSRAGNVLRPRFEDSPPASL